MYHPSRGGVRGGRDQFSWDNVLQDKYKECYLGHSLIGKKNIWDKSTPANVDDAKAELQKLREMEEQILKESLGLAPKSRWESGKKLEKHEFEELTRKGVIERTDKEEADKMSGVGFSSAPQMSKRSREAEANKKASLDDYVHSARIQSAHAHSEGQGPALDSAERKKITVERSSTKDKERSKEEKEMRKKEKKEKKEKKREKKREKKERKEREKEQRKRHDSDDSSSSSYEEIRHDSPSPSRRTRHDSPSPKRRTRHDSPSPKRRTRRDSPSPTRKIRHDSPSPTRKSRRDSPSPKRRTHRDSPSPKRKSRHDSPSPTRKSRHDSPSPTRRTRHDSPSPTRKSRRDSPSPKRRSRHDSP